MIGGIFISYRREDSGGYAGRIFDRLTSRLGHDNVFFDVDAIPPGRDFVEVLSERVGACDALLAVIGKHWVAAVDGENRARLEDPNDFVRIEIEAALKRDVPVIPVLVDGAAMPRADQLPASLKALVRRQAVEISLARFDSDAERLTDALAGIEAAGDRRRPAAGAASPTARSEAPAPAAAPPAKSGGARLGLAAAAVAALVLGGAAVVYFAGRGSPPEVKTVGAAPAGVNLAAAMPASNAPAAYASQPNPTAPAAANGAATPASPAAAPGAEPAASIGDWLPAPEFWKVFEKQRAGFYPDWGSAVCDGGVLKVRAHWTPKPAGFGWYFYLLPEERFQTRNADLTAQGFALQLDTMFKNCAGRTEHLALWTKRD